MAEGDYVAERRRHELVIFGRGIGIGLAVVSGSLAGWFTVQEAVMRVWGEVGVFAFAIYCMWFFTRLGQRGNRGDRG